MHGPANKKAIEELTRLLKRINRCDDPKTLRKEAYRLINCVTNGDITTAERNLISSGYTAEQAKQLSSAFLLIGILEGQGAKLRSRLSENHILRLILAEHELFCCFLAELRDTAASIYSQDYITDTSTEFMQLCHAVEHMAAMGEHIERENDIIFPYLENADWANICRPARNEHEYIRAGIDELTRLIQSFDAEKQTLFKTQLASVTMYFVPVVSEHLFYEDNVLFPIALEAIKDAGIWSRIKDICGQIGYCGLHT